MKNFNFDEEKLKKFVEENIPKVTEEDIQKVLDKEKELRKKFQGNTWLGQFIKDFKIMFSMVKDYMNGSYREVPWFTIAAVVVALLYVLSPVDFIPDFIPGVGYVDDAFVMGLVLMMIKEDLYRYREWKVQHELKNSIQEGGKT
ncbi:YkvA family protein [Persephonella sp. KM09-Lau-8]|uniref:YkvA family protein n=1 Tax=Persephonella sp. KM09-Lau-8 TaxID=1158345 RepID=UPI000495DEDA|nr:YkvA family protein [Persephonella sp. KM09-Lau-8]